MTKEDQVKWEYLIKKYPEQAGVAYELFLRHKRKNANPTTYFMWAAKLERQTERRYQTNLEKWKSRQKIIMENSND